MTTTTSSSDGARPPAATRTAQNFWTRYFSVYDTLNKARPYQAMLATQIELLAPRPGDRVLDAGTGSGNLAAALVQTGADVVGIDFCEPALALARDKAPAARFRFADLTRPLDFADGEFDLVACSAVLHVLSRAEQRTAMAELARVLRPGGRLVVTAFAHGFNPLSVYRDTLSAERHARGLAAAIGFAARYSWNSARVLYYVWRIQRQQRRGAYAYVDEAGLEALLAASGLEPRRLDRTLAGQCVTALATKPGGDGRRQ